MKKIAIAWAVGLGLVGAASMASAGEWMLAGADDVGVASLSTVKQDSAKSPKVMLEDHVEFDESDTGPAHGMSRFTLYDCAMGTVERGVPRYFKAGLGDEIDTRWRNMPDDWDDAPRTPDAGSYDARLLALACALDRNDPQLAAYPRMPRPFFRADADRARAAADPNWKPSPQRWQGLAIANPASGTFGIASVSGEPSRAAAEAALKQRCAANGWSDCGYEASRQCIAVAYIERELVYFGGTGTTEANALREAYASCRKDGLQCDNDMTSCP